MQTLKVLLKAANFCVSLVVILTMCAAGAFSVYALWDNSQVYRAAGDVQSQYAAPETPGRPHRRRRPHL